MNEVHVTIDRFADHQVVVATMLAEGYKVNFQSYSNPQKVVGHHIRTTEFVTQLYFSFSY